MHITHTLIINISTIPTSKNVSSFHFSKHHIHINRKHHRFDWTLYAKPDPISKQKPNPIPKQRPPTFAIPIFKDTKTGLYYTNMTVGQPPLSVNLVLDVSGSALFFQCGKPGYKSTSYDPILCGSRCCPTPKDECFHNTCYGPFRPTCRNETCTSADVSLVSFAYLSLMPWQSFLMVLTAFSDSLIAPRLSLVTSSLLTRSLTKSLFVYLPSPERSIPGMLTLVAVRIYCH